MEFSQIRKQADITQKELSSLLNIDRTTVSKWETGKSTPRLQTMQQLADILKSDLATITSCFMHSPEK